MDIAAASTISAQLSLSFDWLHYSKLPAKLLTRFLRLVLGLAISSMANAVLVLLKQGDSREAVRDLQQRLTASQCHDDSANVHFGPHTRRPIETYQQRYGATVAGVVAPQRLSVLEDKSTPTQPRFTASRTDRHNESLVDAGSTAIGDAGAALPSGQFVVIVPQRHGLQLEIVKQLVPDAIAGQSRMGCYIQAGTFASQSAAAQQSRFLQAYGLDAQVRYC